MASGVSAVYIHVIDDVVSKVREEFINYGAGESVLNELQALWEMKMVQCAALSGIIERQSIPRPGAPITPVHDLNMPPEEYETPTAEMLFPPTPLQTPIQTPLPGLAQTPLPGMVQTPLPGMMDHYNIRTGSSDYGSVSDDRNGLDPEAGKPSPYMQPPSPWMNQRSLGVDVNVAYVEGRDEVERGASHQSMTQDFLTMSGKRKRDDYASQLNSKGHIPQQDGSGDVTIEFVLPKTTGTQNSVNRGRSNATAKAPSVQGDKTIQAVPQQDGVHDEYDDMFHYQGGVASEDYNTPAEHVELRAATPSVGTPKPAKSEAVDDDEPPLNEDDDDDEDLEEGEQGDVEPTTQHLVLAQFDKVSRTKSRWKCTLKDGIMHINGRDILFNKANGEFDF